MRIDRRRLNQVVAHYMQTPAAEEIYEEFEVPWLLRLVVTIIAFFVGIFLVSTIIGIRLGWRCLVFAVGLKGFETWEQRLRQDPDQLRPLIAHGIIIGPTGHGLVLGTFDERVEQNVKFMTRMASLLAKIYADGPLAAGDEPLAELLQKDTYRRNRRRRVPEPRAGGRELYLFDVKIDQEQVGTGPLGGMLVACVATTGEDGIIHQIPWTVAKQAQVRDPHPAQPRQPGSDAG